MTANGTIIKHPNIIGMTERTTMEPTFPERGTCQLCEHTISGNEIVAADLKGRCWCEACWRYLNIQHHNKGEKE